ncbi:MAG: GAF domain-containing sensor histidine kinase [Candidatus Lernaella stagnicola]|nr:GAF domain-containing sensor histidine kinase [Candidatus Lernaella stagnicola]
MPELETKGPHGDVFHAALEEIKEQISDADTLKDTLRFLFRKTREFLPIDRMSIAFVEEENQRLRSYFTLADYEPVLLAAGYSEDLRDSSLETVIAAGQPRLINDLEEYLVGRPDSRSTRLVVKEGIRSSLACPLLVDGRVVGVLFYSSRQPHAFTVRHIELHTAIVSRMSRAIDKAYRFEQLKAANDAYMEMLGFVVHELKSPVASILSLAGLITGGYQGEVSDLQRDTLDRIKRKGEYLLSLVGEYLNLASIETGELTPTFSENKAFARDLLEPAIDLVSPQLLEKKMQLRRHVSQDLPPVELDARQMQIVLVNLLGNAVKYGYEGGAVDVTVTAESETLRVAVRNEGPGFTDADKAKLFRKFSRLDAPELKKQKGTGVGLYTVWRIVQAHGGRITAASELGKWAEFTVRQPLRQI